MDKSRTTTIVTAVAIAALVFGLVGCDNEADVTPSTPTEAEQPEQAEPVEPVAVDPAPDDVFIETIRTRIPDVSTVPDADLITLGDSICYGFDTGQTFDSLTLMGLAEGFSAYTIGSLIGVSIASYCPEHFDQIPA
jgi:uncharacterized lipoprotein NlpE involved in copper resistance